MLKTERMDRVRAALRAQGLTQMIVCDPKSVWYLTGVAVEPYERLLRSTCPTEGEPVLFLNRLFNGAPSRRAGPSGTPTRTSP